MSDCTTLKRCTKCGREPRASNSTWCRKCKREYDAIYVATHKEQQREQRKAWSESHKEWKREYDRKRRVERKEDITAQRAIYRSEQRERIRSQKAADYMAHKDRYIANNNKRRARIKQVGGAYTVEDIRYLYSVQHGQCAYCGCDIARTYEVDHIIPVARGGSNWPDNLALTCKRCNRSKGSKLPSEWSRPLPLNKNRVE